MGATLPIEQMKKHIRSSWVTLPLPQRPQRNPSPKLVYQTLPHNSHVGLWVMKIWPKKIVPPSFSPLNQAVRGWGHAGSAPWSAPTYAQLLRKPLGQGRPVSTAPQSRVALLWDREASLKRMNLGILPTRQSPARPPSRLEPQELSIIL